MECSDCVLEDIQDYSSFDYTNFISEYDDGIIDKKKILMLYNNLNPNASKNYKLKFTKKKFYQLSTKMILPTDFINDLNNTNFFKQLNLNANDIYINNILSHAFFLLYYQGLDSMIYYHFLMNNKKIWRLDNNDDNDDKHNRELNKLFDKCDKSFIYLAFMIRIFYGKKWINEKIPNDAIRNLYNIKEDNIIKNDYIIYERNRIWIPKINNYMETLEYPLFVVGCAHIPDLLNLLNDTNLYHIKKN